MLARTIPDRQVRASTTPNASSGAAGQTVNSKRRRYETGFTPPLGLALPAHRGIDQRRDQDERALEHVLIGL